MTILLAFGIVEACELSLSQRRKIEEVSITALGKKELTSSLEITSSGTCTSTLLELSRESCLISTTSVTSTLGNKADTSRHIVCADTALMSLTRSLY